MAYDNYSSDLYHFGIKGMKWGVRRYQNKDGTLTDAGKKRYDRDDNANREWIKRGMKAVASMTAIMALTYTALKTVEYVKWEKEFQEYEKIVFEELKSASDDE